MDACRKVSLCLQLDSQTGPEVLEKIATAVLAVARKCPVDPTLIAHEALGQISLGHDDKIGHAMRDAAQRRSPLRYWLSGCEIRCVLVSAPQPFCVDAVGFIFPTVEH